MIFYRDSFCKWIEELLGKKKKKKLKKSNENFGLFEWKVKCSNLSTLHDSIKVTWNCSCRIYGILYYDVMQYIARGLFTELQTT